jgi:hypothetical protein
MEHFIEQVSPYYHGYINQVKGPDVLSFMKKSHAETMELLSGITEEKSFYSYAPGKWTIKEVLGHLIDSERIFSYRALRIARKDKQNLPGFEQDDYVITGKFNKIKWSDLLHQFKTLRESTMAMLTAFDDEDYMQEGMANNAPTNVKALVYIIAGHEKHHVNVLKEKYLKN